MATVTQVLQHDGWILYEIGKSNWEHPSVLTFDGRVTQPLTSSNLIDLILLGEGYLATDQADFETHLGKWYDTIFGDPNNFTNKPGIWPYNQFIHAFRVRGVFTPSAYRADTSGSGYFGITLNPAKPSEIDFYPNDPDNLSFREKLFDVLQFIKEHNELNTRIYPQELTIDRKDEPGETSPRNTIRGSSTYQKLMRNCIAAIALMDTSGPNGSGSSNISGFYSDVSAPPDHPLGDGIKISVAFGRSYPHEFSHAFSLLIDEYIDERETFALIWQDPSHLSVFELWNVAFSSKSYKAPWLHLSYLGIYKRSPDSRVGQMWIGGKGKEKGVWHSEYKCLMNGGHKNYYCRTDEPDQFDSNNNQVFADLRWYNFCIWCEEIVTIKILEKTDAFLRYDDIFLSGGDINKLGDIWYLRWVNELRQVYWSAFAIESRVQDREQDYQNPAKLNSAYFNGNLSNTNLMKKIAVRKKAPNHVALMVCEF